MYYELTDYYYPEDYEDFDDSNIRTDNIFELDDEMMLDEVTNDLDCIQFTKYTMDVLEKFLLDSDDDGVRSLMRVFFDITGLEQTENCQKAMECDTLLIHYTKQMIEYLNNTLPKEVKYA